LRGTKRKEFKDKEKHRTITGHKENPAEYMFKMANNLFIKEYQ